jgi:hypothetical protein
VDAQSSDAGRHEILIALTNSSFCWNCETQGAKKDKSWEMTKAAKPMSPVMVVE